MKEYCRLTTCRRAFLRQLFACDDNFVEHLLTTNCCDVCDDYIDNVNSLDDTDSMESHDRVKVLLTHTMLKSLSDYFGDVNSNFAQLIDSNYLTGLDDDLARDIVTAFVHRFDISVVDEQFGYISEAYVHQIKTLLTAFCSD